jgi:hypothetical protein
MVSGLSSQQLANDPGGDRYLKLIDNAVAMFSEHVFGRQDSRNRSGSVMRLQTRLRQRDPVNCA